MIHSRIYPITKNPLKLSCDNEFFLCEIKSFVKDPKKDLSSLFNLLKPFSKYFVRMLTNKCSPKDDVYISFSTLFLAFEESINLYVTHQSLSDIKSDMNFIIVKAIHSIHFLNKHISATYIQSLVLRTILSVYKDYILSYNRKIILHNEYVNSYQPLNDFTPIDDMIDIHYIMQIDPWTYYLWLLIKQGYTSSSIAKFIHIPRETIYYEELHIWQQLQQLLTNKL